MVKAAGVNAQPGTLNTLQESIAGLALLRQGQGTISLQANPASAPPEGVFRAAISLADANALAVARNYSLASTRARAEGASYLARESWAGLLPTVALRSAKGREISTPSSVLDPATNAVKPTDTHSREEAYAVLTQPIFNVGAISEIRRTRAVKAATEATLRGASDDAAYALVTAYFGLVESGLAMNIAKEHRERLNRLLTRISERVEAGGASIADRERIRARVLAATSAAENARGALDLALITFAKLTGVVPGQVALPNVTKDDALSSLDNMAEMAELAREDNSLVNVARHNREAAKEERRSILSNFLPRLDFQLSRNRINNAGGVLGSQVDTRGMFVLSLPLFSGFADYNRQLAIAAKEEQYRYEALDAQRNAEEGINITYSTLRASSSKLISLRQQVVANAKVVEAYEYQLTNTSRSLLDVFDAYQQLYEARNELARTSVSSALLHYQVLRTTGQLASYLERSRFMKGDL